MQFVLKQNSKNKNIVFCVNLINILKVSKYRLFKYYLSFREFECYANHDFYNKKKYGFEYS